MQWLMFVLMFLAVSVNISLQAELTGYIQRGDRCTFCPAGEFQKSCNECAPCPAGSYTTELNQEDVCHRCYRDCRPDYHLKVVKNCSSTSDLKCTCEEGFRCSDVVPLSENCRYCDRIPEAPSLRSNCKGVKDLHEAPEPQVADPCPRKYKAAILCPLAAVGFLALVSVLFLCCRKEESSFKQAMSKICNEGGAACKPKEPTHQFTRDSSSAKQQPSTVSANLGPVHVHSKGTVIVSMVNQITGPVGPIIQGAKAAESERGKEEEEEGDCPFSHPVSPTASHPGVHLSEEERSVEGDSLFLPSQEQGKDFHVSTEEVL